MFTLPRALRTLFLTFITELVARAKGQTTCEPLMQALVQQAEQTNSYGSWDACCARTGIDCYLTRQAVPPGYEPCDVLHSARAGCNRLAQGTVCMIGGDGEISGSPCGASVIRTCGSLIARGDGVAIPFDPPSDVEATFASILSRGVLDSQLCCSTSACTFASPCTSQYNMSACVTDEVNIICIPLDQPDNTTYAAQIVQDGHNCIVTSSTYASSSTSMISTVTAGGVVPTQDVTEKKGGDTAIIGGSVGGAVGFVFIVIFSIILFVRIRGRRTRKLPSNEWPDHQGTAVTNYAPLFPDLPNSQSTYGHTPTFPSHPGPQWTSAIGTSPSFPGPSYQNQIAFEFPANQNPSQIHQDPLSNTVTHSSYQSQNILEFPSNPLQGYEDPGASTSGDPAFQRPASPPPPSFRTIDFPSAMDTQAMEARIAALENRILALSGPSSEVQAEGSRRQGAEKEEADPPRYHGLE